MTNQTSVFHCLILTTGAVVALSFVGCAESGDSHPAAEQTSAVHKPTESTTTQNPIQKGN